MRNGEKQIQKEGEEANVTQTKKKKKRGKKKTGKRNKTGRTCPHGFCSLSPQRGS